MTYTTQNLPAPRPLTQPVSILCKFEAGEVEIGCVALSLVQVEEPPKFPLAECIYAVVVQDKVGGEFSTVTYLVPITFVVNVRMGFLEPGAVFQPPLRMLLMTPDKPAPLDRMSRLQLVRRLAEFGVPLH